MQALAGVPVKRALVARARGGRETCCPTRCARAARRSTCWICTRRSSSRCRPSTLALARAADYVTFTSASTVRNFFDAAGACDGAAALSPAHAHRVDRAGHQRGAARARADGGRAGRRARHRRSAAGAARRRRRATHARPRGERGERTGWPRRARSGTPRLHLRRTDSTSDRARELALARRAARDAGDGARADRRARAPGTALVGAARAARC